MSGSDGSRWTAGARDSASIPIERFGEASSLVREVAEGGAPQLIAENGRIVAAIVDAQTYDALRTAATQQLLRDLHAAIAESEAGEVVEHDDVFGEIRERLRGRVSPDTQRQLDAL